MEIRSLEDLLDALAENMITEAMSQGLESWSIGASGENIVDSLQNYSIDDLEELREEILEGQKVQVVVDLSDAFLALVESLIEANEEEYDDEDLEDEDDDYEDEDDDY